MTCGHPTTDLFAARIVSLVIGVVSELNKPALRKCQVLLLQLRRKLDLLGVFNTENVSRKAAPNISLEMGPIPLQRLVEDRGRFPKEKVVCFRCLN